MASLITTLSRNLLSGCSQTIFRKLSVCSLPGLTQVTHNRNIVLQQFNSSRLFSTESGCGHIRQLCGNERLWSQSTLLKKYIFQVDQKRYGKSRTISQAQKNIIKRRYAKKKVIPEHKKVLLGPQRKGVVVKLTVRTPRKPNSAQRKCAVVRLSNGKLVTCYIPGEKHALQEHGMVLIRGGRVQDCPGIKYKVVRNALDCN